MNMSARLCLSYDRILFSLNEHYFNIENALLIWLLALQLQVQVKMLLHMWSYNFNGKMLSIEYEGHDMINKVMKKKNKSHIQMERMG